jgi:hypothetical protein
VTQDIERRIARLEDRHDNTDRRTGKLEVQMAEFNTWRTEHTYHHKRTDRAHADMPGRVIAAVSLLVAILVFAITFYSGGFGP